MSAILSFLPLTHSIRLLLPLMGFTLNSNSRRITPIAHAFPCIALTATDARCHQVLALPLIMTEIAAKAAAITIRIFYEEISALFFRGQRHEAKDSLL